MKKPMIMYYFNQLKLRNFWQVCRGACMIQILIVLTVFNSSFDSYAQSRHIELSDIANMVGLSDPQISPDGKNIVVVVSRPNYDLNSY